MDSFKLDALETGCSIMSCAFDEDSATYYVVGTAYILPEESEPTKVLAFVGDLAVGCLVVDPRHSALVWLCVGFRHFATAIRHAFPRGRVSARAVDLLQLWIRLPWMAVDLVPSTQSSQMSKCRQLWSVESQVRSA